MFTDSFIVSNPEQNNTVSELHHCILLRIPSVSKRYCNKVVPTLDRQLLWQNLNTNKKDRKWFKIVQRNGLLVKEKIMLPKLLKLSHSHFQQHIYTFFILGDLWTFQVLWMSKTSCSYQNCCWWKPPDCLHLRILKADLHLLILQQGNIFN